MISQNFFIDITLMIVVATLLGLIAKTLKQPLVLAYVIAGVIIGPMTLGLVKGLDDLALFSQIGVALLLFIVGSNLHPRNIKEIGKVSLITGIAQVFFTAGIGYLLARIIGFQNIESIYISLALTFSSTIIIIKLLTDRNEIDTLHGKITVGILLIQDIVAVVALMLITGLKADSNIAIQLLYAILKGIGLFIGIWLVYHLIIKRFFNVVSRTQELLFLSSIGWCFVAAIAAIKLGFSLEIGAFLAGVAIANSDYNFEINAKIRPIRDFFIAIFFINLGIAMIFSSAITLILPIIIFSIFTLVIKPLIVFFFMTLLGYKGRTGFLTGLCLAQISEFSLILIALGMKLKHISLEATVVITVVCIVTITGSTYLITYGNKIYNTLERYIRIFEREKLVDIIDEKVLQERYDIILLGCHRIGYNIIKKANKKKILAVDLNPEILRNLQKYGIKTLNADVSDSEVINELAKLKPKIVVSTVPNIEANDLIVKEFRKTNRKTVIFVNARNVLDILDLYKIGADFVTQPEMMAGQKIADYITHLNDKEIRKWGKKYYTEMVEDLRKGKYIW
ncbi:MAG: cation:proton antiporter [Nanoarchaeota archaeon]